MTPRRIFGALVVALLGYEAFTLGNAAPGDTISEIVWALSDRWQVVTFVLPAEVGSDPRITKITSNQATGDMAIEYDSPPRSKGGDTGGNTLVFVELPPGEVPPTPFTIHDADGVTTVIAAAPTDSGE